MGRGLLAHGHSSAIVQQRPCPASSWFVAIRAESHQNGVPNNPKSGAFGRNRGHCCRNSLLGCHLPPPQPPSNPTFFFISLIHHSHTAVVLSNLILLAIGNQRTSFFMKYTLQAHCDLALLTSPETAFRFNLSMACATYHLFRGSITFQAVPSST